MSLYRAENMTVQWSVIAESLTMSGHTKGRHGYGAIMGGVNTTYHHNLIASHTSRAPRFGGGTVEGDSNDHIGVFDFRNNIIYNWGFNSAYGGGRANQNMVNNYMKAGPGTRANVAERIIDAGENDKPGKFYVSGNVIEGNPAISEDNSLGIYISEANAASTEIVSSPFEMDGITPEALRTTSAEEAYIEVLDKAGATYPKQDAVDGRIKKEVKTGKGRFINLESEVGGYPVESELRPETFDTDSDGIPDEWELAVGLDPEDSTDSIMLAEDGNGYTNIENYVNSLVDMDYIPVNPEVEIISPENNQQFFVDEEVVITVEVDDPSDIEKVDFYDSNGYIGTVVEAPYVFTTTLEDGTHFITAQASDVNGYETQATAVAVHVNTETDIEDWRTIDIGETPIEGWTSIFGDHLTVKGAGKIKESNDAFHYAYKKMKQDGEVIVKVDEMTPVDHHAFTGIMIRENLEPDAKAVATGLSYTKAYEYIVVNPDTGKETKMYRNPFAAYLVGRDEKGGKFDEIGENLDSVKNAVESGISLIEDVPFKEGADSLGYYLKLTRQGNVFTAYGSPDGEDWIEIGTKEVEMGEEVYVGLAVDGNKVANHIDNLNTAKFSNFSIVEEKFDEETPVDEEKSDEEEESKEEGIPGNKEDANGGEGSNGEVKPNDEEKQDGEDSDIETQKETETPADNGDTAGDKKVEGEQDSKEDSEKELPDTGVSKGYWGPIGISLIVVGIGSLVIFKKKAKQP